MSQAVEAPHAAANVPIKAQLPLRPNASNVAPDEIKSEQCAACTDSRPSLQAAKAASPIHQQQLHTTCFIISSNPSRFFQQQGV
jgi:pectin methylesterase-like acyl-CoA thioesterase